jgi:hypothetical protein
MYNIYKHIGLLHLCGMIIEKNYGFIFVKQLLFDKLYIISFASIPISWLLCKDECVISYIMKKIENNDYILGKEPENVKDITDLFMNKQHYTILYNINNLLHIFSLVIVNNRTTKISYNIFVPTIILFLLYNYDITYKLNIRKNIYPYFQIILFIYLFTILSILV